MSLNVNRFMGQMSGGGARPNLFKVILNFPAFVNGPTEQASFLCKAASLPAARTGQIDIDFRGRQIKYPGDREFDNWNVTILNDNDFAVRDAFMRWHNGINGFSSNIGFTNPVTTFVDLRVQQLDKTEAVVKEYKIVGAWPINVGEIELGYENRDQIEEFEVEFAYQYWTPSEADQNVVDQIRGAVNRGTRAIEGIAGLGN